MKYKLVIFDMDGTILNTLDDLTHATQYILAQYHFPTRTKEEVRQFVGNGIHKLIERAVPTATSNEVIDEVFEEFVKYYRLHCKECTQPYDGILDLVEYLKDHDVKVAVVSNKEDGAVQRLSDEYFPGLFDISVGERKGIAKKPSPDSVNEVMRVLNIDKKDTVYVGDSEVDIQTANNADIDQIIVEWGFRDKEVLIQNGAKVLVKDVNELKESLK